MSNGAGLNWNVRWFYCCMRAGFCYCVYWLQLSLLVHFWGIIRLHHCFNASSLLLCMTKRLSESLKVFTFSRVLSVWNRDIHTFSSYEIGGRRKVN